jgi:hypothetical protein
MPRKCISTTTLKGQQGTEAIAFSVGPSKTVLYRKRTNVSDRDILEDVTKRIKTVWGRAEEISLYTHQPGACPLVLSLGRYRWLHRTAIFVLISEPPGTTLKTAGVPLKLTLVAPVRSVPKILIACMTSTSNRSTRNSGRERSGVFRMHSRRHSRNSIPSLYLRPRPSWENFWKADSHNRSSRRGYQPAAPPYYYPVLRKDRRCTPTNSGEFATPNREARFLAVQKVVTSIASPSLMTRGGVMRDYSASLAPQAVVVYDAFSRTTAEEGSMTMTWRWLGCSPLICQLARRKYPLSSFISSPSWWR